MKARLAKTAGFVYMAAALAAQATPINGHIGFSGGATLNDNGLNATGFTAINMTVLGGSQTLDYSGVTAGLDGNWASFTFDPAPGSITPLWTITIGAITYSFDATSVVIKDRSLTYLDLTGTGIAHITGFQDTYGSWTLGITGAETSFRFSGGGTTLVSGDAVPDAGGTVALLGLALGGLAFIRRKS